MLIYKVLRPSEWAVLDRDGRTAGAPVDLADGFIHFSTARQLPETLARHFAGERELTLVAVDSAALGDALRWEPSRGGAAFPHLHRDLDRADIAWVRPLDDGPEGPLTPDDLE